MVKVSVIIPYKNDRGYLDQAISSFERQTYGNKELILHQSDHLVGYNLNRGIEKATGDLITYLCDDDMLTDDALENYANLFNGDFCHGNAINFINEMDATYFRPDPTIPSLGDMLITNRIHGGTVCYHASVFERFGIFDESLWGAEEYDFNMMLLSKGATLGYIDRYLYKYRLHNNQKSRGKGSLPNRGLLIKTIKDRYL